MQNENEKKLISPYVRNFEFPAPKDELKGLLGIREWLVSHEGKYFVCGYFGKIDPSLREKIVTIERAAGILTWKSRLHLHPIELQRKIREKAKDHSMEHKVKDDWQVYEVDKRKLDNRIRVLRRIINKVRYST